MSGIPTQEVGRTRIQDGEEHASMFPHPPLDCVPLHCIENDLSHRPLRRSYPLINRAQPRGRVGITFAGPSSKLLVGIAPTRVYRSKS